MDYRKMLGLSLAMAAVAVAFAGAGTASATTLCADTACTETYPAETVLHLEGEGTITPYPAWATKCTQFTYEAKTTNAGSSTETVKANVEVGSISGCESSFCGWTVVKNGTWEIHTDKEDGRTTGESGTLRSNGMELTVDCGFHCVYTTMNTPIGTLTGGSSATLDTKALIPRVSGRSGAICGSFGEWSGSYKVTKPTSLWVR
jgi:hypothetical protein